MYVLHIANKNYSSWSLRPWIMLRMAGIAFEERLHPFNPDGSSREAFLAFSPTGQVPVLEEGELKVWDSLAILEHLAERHDGLWPQDPAARAWARSASAEMHSGFTQLRAQCSMSVGHRIRLSRIDAGLQRDLDRLRALWEDGLARFGGTFLASNRFTIVDAMYAPVAWRINTYDPPVGETARAYADRLLDLEPMRDWERAALAERFREPGHDREIEAVGELLEDRRVQL
ncbi:MAG: glutathione S-transferase family protein [Oceanicaulis sp.]